MTNFNPIQQFYRHPLSRAYAVKAKCAECVGCTPNHLEKGFKESISSLSTGKVSQQPKNACSEPINDR